MSQGSSSTDVQPRTPEVEALARQLAPQVEQQLASEGGGPPSGAAAGLLPDKVGGIFKVVLSLLNLMHDQGLFHPRPPGGGTP